MPRVPTSRYIVFFLLAALGLAADLGTKHVMFTWPALRPQGSVWWLWQEYAGFQNSLNEGALFGFGQGNQMMFGLFSIGAALAIPVWLFVYRAALDWWNTIPLGGITAGVLGNLYDRLALHGMRWGVDWPLIQDRLAGERIHAVRDWILWQLNDELRWPNFNLADVFLVVGAAALILRALVAPTPSSPSEDLTVAEKNK